MNYQHTLKQQYLKTLEEHRAAAVEQAIIEKFQALFDRFPELSLAEQKYCLNCRVAVCRIKRMH